MKKGSKMTIESREKLRISHLGQKAWNKGLVGYRKGSKQTPEWIAKRIAARKKNGTFGFSEEAKKRISLSQIERFKNEAPWNKGSRGRKPWMNLDGLKRHIKKNGPWNKGLVGYHAGKEHYNWQEGKSFEPYSPSFNKKLKLKIKKRDNFQCQECYYTFPADKLCIHHINYNKKDSSENNLIALCRSCHTQTNYGREEWEQYFKNKLTL